MREQFNPAAGTCVAGGDDRDRQGPVNRKVWVVVGDAQVLGGIMRTIDPIANIGSRGQRLEAMQEARRNIEMPKGVVVEQKCLQLTKRRRIPPNVDHHVVNGAVGAADQLRLAAPRAPVHSADSSLHRARLGVLNERRRGSRPAEVVVENVDVEGPGEQSAVVVERLRNEDENVRKIRFLDAHRAMLP